LCRENIFQAVGVYLGRSESEIQTRYQTFISKAKAKLVGGFFNKQVAERFKRRSEFATEAVLNALSLDADIDVLEQRHVAALDPSRWPVPGATIFKEERQRIEDALAGSFEECLKLVPGKEFLNLAADAIGMDRDAYVKLICSALSSDDGRLQSLGNELEACLTDVLPPRRISDGTHSWLSTIAFGYEFFAVHGVMRQGVTGPGQRAYSTLDNAGRLAVSDVEV
jgi:hypothetical protein